MNSKTLIVAGIAVALLLAVAVYFLYVGNAEAGTGAGAAAAAAVAVAKRSRDGARKDVADASSGVRESKEDLQKILDEYERGQKANREQVVSADVARKREMGMEALSPEARAALGLNDTTEDS